MSEKTTVNPISLELFRSALTAIAEEMGVVLTRSSYSPNIKERRDFSCALFDLDGRLVAQAAHIPVHLGSMPDSVASALNTDRKSTRLNSSHSQISYAVFCLKKKKYCHLLLCLTRASCLLLLHSSTRLYLLKLHLYHRLNIQLMCYWKINHGKLPPYFVQLCY